MLRLRSQTRQRLIQAVVPAYLVLCIVLGGASAAGALANAMLQLLALPIIWLACMFPQAALPSTYARQLLGLAGLLALLFLVSLIPLPPTVWTALPGREPIVAGYHALGVAPPWLPLSLAPSQTLASMFWLLPAFAVLLAMLRVGAYKLRWIVWTLAAVMAVSVTIGAVQIAGGSSSPAYFYRFTNWGVAVGFFANTNHLATLLLITIPFLVAELARSPNAPRERKQNSARVVLVVAGLLVAVIGVVITRSLAGIGLLVTVAVASAMLLLPRKRFRARWALPGLAALLMITVGVTLSEPFGNNLTSETAKDDSLSRRTMYANTLSAARDYLPVGSGIGTFVDVYRTREKTEEVARTYINHAHSDPLEILLETGVAGVVLLVLFLLWWFSRTLSIWRSPDRDVYAAAATIATGAVLAHSCVDYPLRTAAISVLFAICLAIMAKPRERLVASRRDGETAARHLAA